MSKNCGSPTDASGTSTTTHFVEDSKVQNTLDDLKWSSALEFKSIGTGEFFTTSNGRKKEVTKGVDIVHTKSAGVMELKQWCRLMEEAVKREGKTILLNRIEERCRNLAWMRNEKEVHQYALQCLSGDAYMAWKDF